MESYNKKPEGWQTTIAPKAVVESNRYQTLIKMSKPIDGTGIISIAVTHKDKACSNLCKFNYVAD